MTFDTIPAEASLQPKPFKAHVSDQELDEFKQLLKLSKIGPKVYENQVANVKDYNSFGITRQWLADTKQHWETRYDFRKAEDRINSFPNYTVPIHQDAFNGNLHFIALFSQKRDAVPLLLMHGWPGSVLEFLGALDIFKSKYTPDTLPFHIVVPSLPGYGYSDGPSLEKDFDTEGVAAVLNKLMVGLGFGNGYIAQGGDVGSFLARILAVNYDECKAAHLHLCIGQWGETDGLSEKELKGVQRIKDFSTMGNAYAREHGTRTATIGLVLSSSPLALLAWVGEKMQQWSHETPPINEILDSVSLYWFTQSFPRAIYVYRNFFGPVPQLYHNDPDYYIKKPLGYSWHPEELSPVPRKWVEQNGNLVWYREHDEGGHFAAWEKPELFVKDMEDFVADIWPKATKL